MKNFTVFSTAELSFSPDLNVIVGDNGTGKTHILKLCYVILAANSLSSPYPVISLTKGLLQSRLAEKLVNVFRPDSLGRLARRRQGRERCEVSTTFGNRSLDISFEFATNSKSEVVISKVPTTRLQETAAYLPTRELLTIFPNFVSVYEGHYLEFEETWRDTCVLLGAPLQRGPRETKIRGLLAPLEVAMGGKIELDKSGRFFLQTDFGRMEITLVAEGLRKLGMVARLIATGSLLGNGYLFWDEPESNLNPRLIRRVARTILDLSAAGIQVFIATHSLFLLRELEISRLDKSLTGLKPHFFGLQQTGDAVEIMQGPSIDDVGDISALDESLEQSDRFVAISN